ncbi:hypothetical protein [Edaphobacter sp. 12200R-103]|jgi:hypothetical protein|uniref:DUF6982 domain-containing protein n=1 Tax=Edaphobacter sp. 12200R-103 TaxID=2703788 RepID=UPI00138D9FD0|nr:hypothetical protein [Edaphobacter sp. 12200R-103]QHS51236.1 hypothetical protein GWR55_05410 [Edaphobacter sp. 12200R-103]
MSSAHKKVILRRLRGDTLAGYLPLSGFVRFSAGEKDRVLDLLDLSGHVLAVPLSEIKHIAYVRDFNLNDTVNPERLTRRTFLARPRTEGLWVRLSFRGQSTPANEPDQLEGLAPLDVSLLDDVMDDAGLFLIPPDVRSNTQRIYVPRTSITKLQLLAVITTPSRKKPGPGTSTVSLQEDLFRTLPPNSKPN